MRSDYLQLVKDTIRFAKEQRSLPFSECFSIFLTDLKPPALISAPKSLKKPLPAPKAPPKEPEKPMQAEPVKPKAPLTHPVEIEVVEDSFEDVRKKIKEVGLQIEHIEKILDDTHAEAMAHHWKYQSKICPILILFHNCSEHEKMFLKNLASALSVYFPKANALDVSEIEKEDKWDLILDPKIVTFIMAPDDQIWDLPKLMKTYKEIPSQSTHTLKDIPLFLIPNLKMYFQNPSLKGSLWKALCQKISPLHPS